MAGGVSFIAMAMALERMEFKPKPVELVSRLAVEGRGGNIPLLAQPPGEPPVPKLERCPRRTLCQRFPAAEGLNPHAQAAARVAWRVVDLAGGPHLVLSDRVKKPLERSGQVKEAHTQVHVAAN